MSSRVLDENGNGNGGDGSVHSVNCIIGEKEERYGWSVFKKERIKELWDEDGGSLEKEIEEGGRERERK